MTLDAVECGEGAGRAGLHPFVRRLEERAEARRSLGIRIARVGEKSVGELEFRCFLDCGTTGDEGVRSAAEK